MFKLIKRLWCKHDNVIFVTFGSGKINAPVLLECLDCGKVYESEQKVEFKNDIK